MKTVAVLCLMLASCVLIAGPAATQEPTIGMISVGDATSVSSDGHLITFCES